MKKTLVAARIFLSKNLLNSYPYYTIFRDRSKEEIGMVPTLILNDKEYVVVSIWWDDANGIISHVTYTDEDGEINTIFRRDYNFEEVVIWRDKLNG